MPAKRHASLFSSFLLLENYIYIGVNDIISF